MGNDDVKNKMGNDDHSHISAFLMGFRRVRGLILKRFDISSKVLTSVSQYDNYVLDVLDHVLDADVDADADNKPWSWAPHGGRFAPEPPPEKLSLAGPRGPWK